MQAFPHEPFKWIPPATPFGYIERPRLQARLVGRLSARLLLLRAPRGYGKTAILASLAGSWERLDPTPAGPLAWYSLDGSDDDPAVFVEGLTRAVHAVAPGVGHTTLALLRSLSDARPEMARLTGVLCQEILDSGLDALYVVLDDLHLITDKALLEALDKLIKDGASPLRFIVATETEPPFYLSNLRSQGAMVEIGEEDLRLRPDEAIAMLEARGVAGIGAKAVDSVVRETHGWPSATSVAAAIVCYSGKPLPFTRLAPTEHGYGQLVREVLNGLPEVIRQSMLRSSLLSVVDVEGLRRLSGVAAPDVVLDTVEALMLPSSPISSRGRSVRYDPLLRSALERELVAQIPPQEMRLLYKDVAQAFAEAGLWDAAFDGYLRGWAHEEAASLVESAAPEQIALGHIDTVLRWIRALPNVTRKGRPRLMVHEARALLARGQAQDTRVLLTTVEPLMVSADDRQGIGERAALLVELQFAEGRYWDAAETARHALAQLPEEDLVRKAEVLLHLGHSLEMLGDLTEAVTATSEGLSVAELSGRQRLVVGALERLSRLLELKGQYSAALSLTFRAVDRARALGLEDLAVLACGGTAASIYLERGQRAEAEAAAKGMLEVAGRLRDRSGNVRAELFLAKSQAFTKETSIEETVDLLLSSAGKERGSALDRVMILQWASAALLNLGRRREGVARAREAEKLASSIDHQPSVMTSRLLAVGGDSVGRDVLTWLQQADSRRWLSAAHRIGAQRYLQVGNRWWAKDRLRKSLSLAAQEGYIGLPLGLPSKAEALFEFAARHDIEPTVAGSLLGVRPERARRVLEPLFKSQNASIRARAEAAAKGLEMGHGRAPAPRLAWPGTVDDLQPAPVVFQTLGGIIPFVDEQEAHWPSTDARDLAAYFVVRRATTVPRSSLLQDLWPGLSEVESLVRLHVALAEIRQTLGAGYPLVSLEKERDGEYYWDGGGCFIDVEHFRALMRTLEGALAEEQQLPFLSAPTVRMLEEAVGIYQGEFLDGLDFPWCIDQREELRAQILRSTRLLMDHFMGLREWRDAIRHGEKSLKSDPLQEDVVRDLMLCYFRVGDRASVSSQYRELKRVAAKERGAWPSEETRQLRVRLLGK